MSFGNTQYDPQYKQETKEALYEAVREVMDASYNVPNEAGIIFNAHDLVQGDALLIQNDFVNSSALLALDSINRRENSQYNDVARKMILEAVTAYYKKTIPHYDSRDTIQNIKEIHHTYFSYQDVLIDEQAKKGIEGDMLPEIDNERKYIYAFIHLQKGCPLATLERMAEEAEEEVSVALSFYNITPSEYCFSKTWFLWDVSKQYYYALYPEETTARYRNKTFPPLDFNVINEILYRHIGWEFHANFSNQEDKSYFLESIPVTSPHLLSQITDLVTLPKKESNNSLSSYDLARLGELLYRGTRLKENSRQGISENMSFRIP